MGYNFNNNSPGGSGEDEEDPSSNPSSDFSAGSEVDDEIWDTPPKRRGRPPSKNGPKMRNGRGGARENGIRRPPVPQVRDIPTFPY